MPNLLRKCVSSGLGWLWIAGIVILLDHYSKLWMTGHLLPFESFPILSIFNFTLAFNKGAAFGFLHSAPGWQNLVLCSFACVISIVILVWLYRSLAREYWLNTALNLIMGGALGNVVDRLHYGYVIDFLDFHLGDWHFAIFNVADSAICIGAFMLCWHWLKPTLPNIQREVNKS